MQRYALILFAAFAWHQAANAWDCSGREDKEQQLVFDGKVGRHKVHTFEDDPAIGDRDDVTFSLTKPVLGSNENEITVQTELWFNGGFPFNCGKRYRVHAVKRGGIWYTNVCYSSTPLSPGAKSLTEVEEALYGDHALPEEEQDALMTQIWGCK